MCTRKCLKSHYRSFAVLKEIHTHISRSSHNLPIDCLQDAKQRGLAIKNWMVGRLRNEASCIWFTRLLDELVVISKSLSHKLDPLSPEEKGWINCAHKLCSTISYSAVQGRCSMSVIMATIRVYFLLLQL